MIGIQDKCDFSSFLDKHNLKLVSLLSKGFSSNIYLVSHKEKTLSSILFVVKAEHIKSPRNFMVENESNFLKLANSVQVGPKLIDFDLSLRVVLMQYVDGVSFVDWVSSSASLISASYYSIFLNKLFKQAFALDKINLSHGQLGGKGKNVLVSFSNKIPFPVIIDFEKASVNRKAKNVAQLFSLIFENPNGFIKNKSFEILGKKKFEEMRKHILTSYFEK